MKFSYTARIILAIGICAVAVFMLYQSYSEKVGEEAELNNRVVLAQGTLPKLINEQEELQEQLTFLENEVKQADNLANQAFLIFDRRVESIEYDTILFQLAHERDLDVVRLAASEPQTQETHIDKIYDDPDLVLFYDEIDLEANDEVEPLNFILTSFAVEVKGKQIPIVPKTEREHETYINQTLSNIIDFINDLIIRDDFSSVAFELVTFEIPKPLTTFELEEMSSGDLPEEEVINRIRTASAVIRFTIYNYEGE